MIFCGIHFILRLIIRPVSGPHRRLPHVTLVGLGDVSIGGRKIIPAGVSGQVQWLTQLE